MKTFRNSSIVSKETVLPIDIYEFTSMEDLYSIEVKFSGKIYQVNMSTVFEPLLLESGTYDEDQAFIRQELMSAIRGEFNTIITALSKEYNDVMLRQKIFLAEKGKEAEEKILQSRTVLVEAKKKKDLGQITSGQIETWIINNYTDDYIDFEKQVNKLSEHINSIKRLDFILSEKSQNIKERNKKPETK